MNQVGQMRLNDKNRFENVTKTSSFFSKEQNFEKLLKFYYFVTDMYTVQLRPTLQF